MACQLCPRACKPRPGQKAFCFVRENRGGEMVLTTYGRSSGFCVDPIEKKPLNHFYPGTAVLSFGTAGCNLGCKFCQNWNISKAREWDRVADRAGPEQIARAALDSGCKSVAFTYNDPVIWAEYAIDCATVCRQVGLKSVAVTAGYIEPAARREFFGHLDAANIDLKAMTDSFYRKVTLSDRQPVLDTIRYVARETEVWLEVTTLLIPGLNDSEAEISELSEWLCREAGEEVPLHFTAFHPDFRMRDIPRTPISTLRRARELAQEAGLRHVYTGNVHDVTGQSTYCATCGECVIERNWYEIGAWRVDPEGTCSSCSAPLAGRFEAVPGDWGAKRLPLAIG